MNSPVRLGVSPTAASAPTGIFSQRLWDIISRYWNSGLCGLSHSPVAPPSLSARECGITHSTSHCLTSSVSHRFAYPSPPATALPWVLSTQLPIPTPHTDLDECFFFNSLVVGLPYSSIFCQFWLFFVFKFIVVLLLVVWGGSVSTYASILARSWSVVLKWCAETSRISTTYSDSLLALAMGWQLEGHQWHAGERWGVWHQGEQKPLSLF